MPILVLGDVIVALLAVILALAATTLAYLASKLIPHIPVIGGYLRDAVVGALNSLSGELVGWANDALIPIAYVFQDVALVLWWALYIVDSVLNDVVSVGKQTITYIDAVQADVVGYAQELYHQSVDYTRTVEQGLSTEIVSFYNSAIHIEEIATANLVAEIESVYARAEQYSSTLYNEAIAYTNGLVAPIEADIRTVASVFEGDLSGAVSSLKSQIVTVESNALAEIESAISTADATAKALATAAEGSAVAGIDTVAADVLNPALDWLTTSLGKIATAIPSELAGTLDIPGIKDLTKVGSLGVALSALTALSVATATEVADCLVPNCDPLNELSQAVNDLEQAAVWTAIIALVTQAVTNPAAAVSDLSGDIARATDVAATPIYDLVGLA